MDESTGVFPRCVRVRVRADMCVWCGLQVVFFIVG